MLFVGDVTYDFRLLAAGRVPGVGDAEGLRETTRKINELVARYPGMPVLAAHDPAARSLLKAAVNENRTERA
jgi:N-acyl homoserine lactone hydrolase